MTPLQITIDGPVGAGKSDIAQRLSKELGLFHLYTGAMYRSLANECLKHNIAPTDTEKVIELLNKTKVELLPEPARGYKILVNGEDVTEELFEDKVSSATSTISKISQVRQHMVEIQKGIAHNQKVVADGRDTAKKVIPNAPLKIYLDADVQVRARRRWEQQKAQGKDAQKTLEEVLADTIARDDQDMHRQVDPLERTNEMWHLDTTEMTQDQVIEAIKNRLVEMKLL